MTESVGIVGAGPAGEAAARVLAEAGVPHEILDENPRAGGNINRRRRDAAPTAMEARHRDGGATRFRPGCFVLGVTGRRSVQWIEDGRMRERTFDAVLLCTGAYDGQYPRPGLAEARCTTAGALQALLKGQGLVPEGRIVLCGGGPFLYVVAADLLRAGAAVTHVVDRVTLAGYLSLVPSARAMPGNLLVMLRALSTLRRGGVRVIRGSEVVALGRESLTLDDGRSIPFDHVGISDFFAPQTQLSRSAGCRHEYSTDGHYYYTATDAFGRSSIDGIFVCGEGQGIHGHAYAELSGALAACAVLQDQGRTPPPGVPVPRLLKRRDGQRAFARRLEQVMYARTPRFPDDAWLCGCERVPVKPVREAVRFGLEDLSSIKIVTRCGMGNCQGRYCEPLVSRVVEEMAGHPPRAPFNQNGLVRPVRVAELVDA